jgi:DNA-binding transcriptional LysR family regulator
MEFYQLQGFLEVAESQSFTQAAKNLFLTQPALSLQIKALETEIGEPLFERQGKQVQLTPAGRMLQERAEEILALVGQTQQELQAARGLQSGSLRLGASDHLCLYVLPPVMHFFQERFPGVELQFFNRQSAEVVSAVAEGRVDFGLVTLPVVEPKVKSESLFWREDVAICHPDHPLAEAHGVTLEMLAAYPLLLLERSSHSRLLLEQMLAKAGLMPDRLMELGSLEVIKRLVSLNLGVSILPGYAIAPEIKAGLLHPIRLPWLPTRSVGVVQRRRGFLSPAGQMFLNLLKNHVPNVWLCPI